ncbi:TPA: phage tailspike protein, partial [Proteus mirabilis]
EDGSHIPVPQPLIINQAGFPVYNGQIAKFVTVEGHSMAVYDSYGAQQHYYPNVLKYDPDQFEVRLMDELKNGNGSIIGIGGGNNLSEITGDGGASLIGINDGRSVQDFITANDSAEYRARNMAKLASVNYKIKTMQSIRVLFQGDSITAGYDMTSTDSVSPENGDWAKHASITYPERFVQFMSEQLGVSVQPVVRAISGFTAQQAYEHADWQDNPSCDIVFLMYGINDSGGGGGATHESYMKYMELLIRRFIKWGMGVVVMTCAAGGKGEGDPKFQAWAEHIKNTSKIYGCQHFNAHEVFYNRRNGSVQSDAIHFNSAGYSKLGEALTSMLGAGGLSYSYVPVSSEISVWPGITSDSVGWSNPTRNVGLWSSDYAYTNAGIVGLMPKGEHCVLSFHFYQASEAVEVDIIGSWAEGTVSVFFDNWYFPPGPEYYKMSGNIGNTYPPKSNISSSLTHVVLAAADGNSRNGQPKFIATMHGRGWKTITIFTPFDGSASADTYIQMLTIRPVNKLKSNALRRGAQIGYVGATRIMLPEPSPTTVLPDAVVFNEITIPMPDCLNSYLTDNNSEFYDSGICKILIKVVGGDFGAGFLEGILMKTGMGVSGYTFFVNSKSGSFPAITAREISLRKDIYYAKGQFGANMPQSDIYGKSPQVALGTGSSELGRHLVISADWSGVGSVKTGYWSIELWGMDFGGAPSASAV